MTTFVHLLTRLSRGALPGNFVEGRAVELEGSRTKAHSGRTPSKVHRALCARVPETEARSHLDEVGRGRRAGQPLLLLPAFYGFRDMRSPTVKSRRIKFFPHEACTPLLIVRSPSIFTVVARSAIPSDRDAAVHARSRIDFTM